MELRSDNYLDCYKELVAGLKAGVAASDKYSEGEKAYLEDLTDGMQVWADVCTKIVK